MWFVLLENHNNNWHSKTQTKKYACITSSQNMADCVYNNLNAHKLNDFSEDIVMTLKDWRFRKKQNEQQQQQ